MNSKIEQLIELMNVNAISPKRKILLESFAKAITSQMAAHGKADLVFICTHNSRRSQLSQVWASVFANKHHLNITAFSGGTEATAVAPQVISTLKYFGFDISSEPGPNSVHKVSFSETRTSISLSSKLFDDSENPTNNFIAAMTCSDADENCPIIHGCSDRIPLTYNDPKLFDGSAMETTMYQFEAFKIGLEVKYTFSLLN